MVCPANSGAAQPKSSRRLQWRNFTGFTGLDPMGIYGNLRVVPTMAPPKEGLLRVINHHDPLIILLGLIIFLGGVALGGLPLDSHECWLRGCFSSSCSSETRPGR